MTTVPGLTIQNSQDCACVHSLVPCLAALLSAHFTPALLQSIRFVVLSNPVTLLTRFKNGIWFMIQGTPSKLQCLEFQGRKFRTPPQFLPPCFQRSSEPYPKEFTRTFQDYPSTYPQKRDWKPQKTTLSERLARFLGVLNQIYQRGWLP